MYRITELRKKLEKFNNEFQTELDKIVLSSQNVKEMTRMNEEQLSKGLKTDSSPIIPPYSRQYAQRRRRRGLQINNVDLRVTGALYRNINVMHVESGYLFYSSVNYSRYLENRYATRKAHIYGLTDRNLELIRAKVIIELKKRVLSL